MQLQIYDIIIIVVLLSVLPAKFSISFSLFCSICSPLDNGIDMIDDKSCSKCPFIAFGGNEMIKLTNFFPLPTTVSQSEEFMISGSEDNLVAYRIVHVPDSTKASHSLNVASSSSSMNNAATSNAPQQLQYFVIDNSNGFIQAVSASQLTTVSNTPLKIEQVQTNSAVNTLKMRSSVAIAPKVDNIAPYSTSSACSSSTNNLSKSNVRIKFLNASKRKKSFSLCVFLFFL